MTRNTSCNWQKILQTKLSIYWRWGASQHMPLLVPHSRLVVNLYIWESSRPFSFVYCHNNIIVYITYLKRGLRMECPPVQATTIASIIVFRLFSYKFSCKAVTSKLAQRNSSMTYTVNRTSQALKLRLFKIYKRSINSSCK